MAELDKALKEILSYPNWRHRVKLAPGLHTQGYNTIDEEWERNHLPDQLLGKSFLDVGANDGYFSFEAEQRGATEITAIDIYSGTGETMLGGWDISGISMLKEYLKSKVEIENRSIFDLTEKNRKWDVVFCSDVLSWLSDIPTAISQLTEVANEKVIIKDTFNLDNKVSKIISHDHGLGEIYRMNIKYLTEQLENNGYTVVNVAKVYTFEQYEWQAKHFLAAFSSAEIQVFNCPDGTEVKGKAIIDGEWALSEHMGFVYVRNTGWVKKSDIRTEPRFKENPIKKMLKKLMTKPMLESYYAKNNEEKSIGEMVVTAIRKR